MEHQITEEEKKMAREIIRVLKVDNPFDLANPALENNTIAELVKKNRQDLADALSKFQKDNGMTMSDIIPELEIDDNFGEELKQMEKELNEH